jgi:hypothetical protein
MPDPAFAYLSHSKVHLSANGATRVIESEFERTVRERAASIERRHAWKSEGTGAQFMGLGGRAGVAASDVPVLITGMTAQGGNVLYTLETDAVSGVFQVDPDGVETRLFHTADFRIRHAHLHSSQPVLTAAAFGKDGLQSNIVTLAVHGTDLQEVTDGDSLDQAPSWVPGERRRIVFQSSGVGRNRAGAFAGLGPCAIQKLDLDSGHLEEIAADPACDFLQPRESADGALYCIRKPYETGVPKASLLGALQDAVLFPFRLGRAVVQYFNVFSMMYTGKPLLTAKGAMQRQMDPRQMFIYGNLASAALASRSQEDATSFVPSSWELVRMEHGRAKVLAKSVLSFDLCSDGAVLFTDGKSVTRLTPSGETQRLANAGLIERVLAF